MRGSRGAGAPQLPGSRRWEVGSGSCSLAANRPQASAKHCKCSRRNRRKTSRCRPRSLLPKRGVRQRAAGCGKQGMQRTSSPLRPAKNRSLFFLSCCFLFSPARGTRRVLCTTSRRVTGRCWENSRLEKFAHASRISRKNCSEILRSFLIEVNKVQQILTQIWLHWD